MKDNIGPPKKWWFTTGWSWWKMVSAMLEMRRKELEGGAETFAIEKNSSSAPKCRMSK